MNAEQIVIAKLTSSFSLAASPDDEWIEANPYVFEKVSAAEAKELMPAYMVFVLEQYRAEPGSRVYLCVLQALNDYSKCKLPRDPIMGFWALLSQKQKEAVLAFLQHLLHNQPANIDQDISAKIIRRWKF